nr:hypothetical protein [Endozoicomonas sp.]
DRQYEQTSKIKQPDTSREGRGDSFFISSNQLTKEQLEETKACDLLTGKIALNKNNTRINVTSQDSRIEEVYGSAINGHFQKSNSLPARIRTGSVLARPTPGGMEMIDGILHYVENAYDQSPQEIPTKPHRKSDKAATASVPFCVDQRSRSDILFKTNRLITPLTYNSDQKQSSPDTPLDHSLNSIFKQLSQREKTDLDYRKTVRRKFKELTGEPEKAKEKTLLFLDDNETILGWDHHEFFSSLFKTLGNTHKNEKPNRILFLIPEGNFESKTHKALNLATEKLTNLYHRYSHTKDINVKCSAINAFYQQLKKEEEKQQTIKKLTHTITTLINYCRQFYDYNKKIKDCDLSPDSLELVRIDYEIWSAVHSLALLILNTGEPSLLDAIVQITIDALFIRQEKNQNGTTKIFIFFRNKELINKIIELLFENITIDFNDSEHFTTSTRLLRIFFEKRYLNPVQSNSYSVDVNVKLRIINTFIDKICKKYQNCKDPFSGLQDQKKPQKAITRLHSYATNFRTISALYSSITQKTAFEITTITEGLDLIHKDLVDEQLVEYLSPKKTKSGKKKK